VPLPYCNNEGATYAFLDRAFNRFGALPKVITYQSTLHEKFLKKSEKNSD
jgi:hypothetical protein